MLSSHFFGEELHKVLSKTDDPIQISRWADHMYHNFIGEMPTELRRVLVYLGLMSSGPEFELTKEQLLLLAEKLIKEEKDPLKFIYNQKPSA